MQKPLKNSLVLLAAMFPIFAEAQLSKTTSQAAMTYPETKKEDVKDNYFGTTVADPYRWLEDDRSEATKAWVTAQNKTTILPHNRL